MINKAFDVKYLVVCFFFLFNFDLDFLGGWGYGMT